MVVARAGIEPATLRFSGSRFHRFSLTSINMLLPANMSSSAFAHLALLFVGSRPKRWVNVGLVLATGSGKLRCWGVPADPGVVADRVVLIGKPGAELRGLGHADRDLGTLRWAGVALPQITLRERGATPLPAGSPPRERGARWPWVGAP